jgi:hypothetical protein
MDATTSFPGFTTTRSPLLLTLLMLTLLFNEYKLKKL